MTQKTFFLLPALCLFSVISLFAQTPAFPGAYGGGMYTTGGRGGTVYFVNTLEDNDEGNSATREGSLRWCINRSGARTIVFKVSGTIMLKSDLDISNGNLTIAGQTAPGGGICLANFPVSVAGSNIIIRYMRFRMGEAASDGADALGGRFFQNVIVDHCSASWSVDECVSFYGCDYFTLQWCIISESLRASLHSKGNHGYGGIWGGTNATFHHNLIAHHDSRCPRFGPGRDDTPPLTETVDFRNNVMYNYGNTYGGEAMRINMVNNFYKPGPKNGNGAGRGRILSFDKDKDTIKLRPRFNLWGQLYIDGNVVDDGKNNADCNRATADNWTYGVYNQFHGSYTDPNNKSYRARTALKEGDKEAMKMNEPFKIYGLSNNQKVESHLPDTDARTAYEQVLSYAGASLKRDSHDARIIEEARTGTATFRGAGAPLGIIDKLEDLRPAGAGDDWSAYPVLVQGEVPKYTPYGVPEGWMAANYPGKTTMDKNEEGYTYLEVYLNSLAGNLTETHANTEIPENRLKLNYDKKTGILSVKSAQPVSMLSVYSLTGKTIYSMAGSASDFIIPFISNSEKIVIIKALTADKSEITEKLSIL